MGDLFKKLDEIMTGDLVRKVGGVSMFGCNHYDRS